jgi:glycosyltransferase involved in cell wall biosynthesis
MTHRLDKEGEAGALARARLVIANSDATRRDLIGRHGLREGAVHTVYYGTDPQVFYPPSGAEREAARDRLGWSQSRWLVAFVGALTDRRKGFDTVFCAWQTLCRDPAWDGELIVIGRGRELPIWQARSHEAGLSQQVRFLGFRCDVPDLLRACDALVSPTRYEAYGLNVHEALCCGLPALVSASAGVAERFPPELKDLLLPDPDDANDLAARLRACREGGDCYRGPVSSFAAALRGYTWENMGRDIVARIEAVA